MIFSSIIILLNLFLPTHINKFLAINIFKNENFESQKFYCNVIDNYNIQYKKNIPYTYNLTNKQLNNLRVIRIYSKYKAPYEYTGLSLNDINSKDLSKIKYAYNKDKNKPDCESNCSTGIINYNFYGYSEKEFKIDTQNVDFTIYYNFYNSEFDTLAINYSNSQYTSLNIYSTQFKKLKMNDNYLDISKLGIKDYPYIVTERIPNEIIISGDRRVFDIESEGWKVIVTDKDGNVKSNDDILEKYDVIKVGKIFKWIVYIHNN